MWSRVWLLLAAAGAARAIQVQRIVVSFEQLHTVTVNNTVEYVLVFSPMSEQALWPTRLWLSAAGGDTARPVILTARQPSGAQTWQLPYRTGAESPLRFELQRTLCFNVSESETNGRSGEFTLHVSTSSASSIAVAARAQPARDWLLADSSRLTLQITPTSSAVHFYRWPAEQTSTRLVLESEDDVCSLVAVQAYSCPVAETENQIQVQDGGFRMTVQRSGSAFVPRERFPDGFYVVMLVLESDEACSGEAATEPPAWLWGAVLGERDEPREPPPRERSKTFHLQFRATLTPSEYWVATTVTLALFVGFYAAFAALVLAQRLPAVKRHVGPNAVLADTPQEPAVAEEGQLPAGTARWRRDSNATLDSLDDDSESDEEREPPRKAPPPAADSTAYSPDSPPPAAPAAPSVRWYAAPPPPPADPDAPVTPPASFADTTPRAGEELAVDPAHATQAPQANGTSGGAGGAGGGGADGAPFGLPARLTLAALARRRARTLRARSDRYLSTLYTVAVFYALPVIQFVAAFQLVMWVSGTLDLCYYNFLCAHPLGALADFNHVFSNLGYLLLGALFMLQLRRRQRRRRRKPKHEEYGIPPHYGLLAALGAGLMVVALLSASYHVCPNRLNFQFDTAFMYVLAVLVMVKLYQARHPDINARAHATFGVLAVLIALVVWGVLGGGPLFWAVFTVLHIFTFLLLSLRIYYLNQFKLEGSALAETARGLRAWGAGGGARPLYRTRLVLLAIANSVNWIFALYGLYSMPANFASHLLYVLLGNALLYMVFYLTMKLRHGERVRPYAWAFTAAAAAAWAPALYYFTAGSSSWSSTPAQSRERNHECFVLQFYDTHDLWHMLSAAALYFSFNALLTWDDGLSDTRRCDIAVF